MDPQETAGIEYRVPAEIPPDEAAELYLEAGWMDHADTAAVSAMLQGTFAVSAAFHNGRLIGFMRAFSDGVSDAYLLDLVVRTEYRKLGIGRNILERLADYLRTLGMPAERLLTDLDGIVSLPLSIGIDGIVSSLEPKGI